MLKKLRKNIILACLFLSLAMCPVLALDNQRNTNSMDLIQQDVIVNDVDIEPINTDKVKKTVVPDTKNEGKKVFAYFLRVMAGVMISALILYVVLLFIKKYYGSAFVNPENDEYFEKFDLSTPKTKKDSLKSFLNRTK